MREKNKNLRRFHFSRPPRRHPFCKLDHEERCPEALDARQPRIPVAPPAYLTYPTPGGSIVPALPAIPSPQQGRAEVQALMAYERAPRGATAAE